MHLGSDTKAMTAVLIGELVEQKRLSWQTMLAEVYPKLATGMDPAMARVTVRELLDHTAGLPHDVTWGLYALLPGDRAWGRRESVDAFGIEWSLVLRGVGVAGEAFCGNGGNEAVADLIVQREKAGK